MLRETSNASYESSASLECFKSPSEVKHRHDIIHRRKRASARLNISHDIYTSNGSLYIYYESAGIAGARSAAYRYESRW